MKKTFVDHHQILTDRMIEQLKEVEKSNWQKPYIFVSRRPFNLETGTKWSGCNRLATSMRGYTDNRWLSFEAVKRYAITHDLEMYVREGEKGTTIFKAIEYLYDKDANGVPYEKPKKGVFMKRAATVFNAQQIVGMPPLKEQEYKFDPIFAFEVVVEAVKSRTGVKIVEAENQANYNPNNHTISIFPKSQAKSERHYYDTLGHELIHSTALEHGRNIKGGFGSKEYAIEEFVAEMGSVFLSQELGLTHDPFTHNNHVHYIKSWQKILGEDKNFIFKASSAASKASNMVMEHMREHLYELEQTKVATPEHIALAAQLGKPERIYKQEQELIDKQQAQFDALQKPNVKIALPSVERKQVASQSMSM